MRSVGVISDYALFGAVAQMRYAEPVATIDAVVLAPMFDYCAKRGYRAEGEAIRVGACPVQFVPVFSPLTREALDRAEGADFEGVSLKVVGAEHLAVIALSVGRAKDFARILSLLEAGAVSRNGIARLAERHGLGAA